jgi:hypothetical protein
MDGALLSQGVHEGVHELEIGCSERVVGAPRFELGTPCTPCKCATRLRHAPTTVLEGPSRREWGSLARAAMIRRNAAAAGEPAILR